MDRDNLLKNLNKDFNDNLVGKTENLRLLLSQDRVDIVEVYSALSGMGTTIAFMKRHINPYLKELREGRDNIKYQKHLYNTLAELYENYSIEGQPGKLDWHRIARDRGHSWVKSFPFDEAVEVALKVKTGELII